MAANNATADTSTAPIGHGLDPPNPALSGTYTLRAVILTVFASMAMFNGLELLVLIFSTFKSYKSLYFWSITIAALGTFPYAIGGMVEFYQTTPRWHSNLWDCIGWLMLVVNQSVVLYSRLHFVVTSRRILQAVKWMIIFNSIVFGTMAILFDYLYIYNIPAGTIANTYGAITRAQMTVFCTQELIISGLYIWKVTAMLKDGSKAQSRKTFIELLIVNVVIVFMDVGVLTLEYIDLYDLMLAVKAFIYTVKLKLELAVLGKLVDIAQNHVRRTNTSGTDLEDSSESFRVDLTKQSSPPVDMTKTNTFGPRAQDFSVSPSSTVGLSTATDYRPEEKNSSVEQTWHEKSSEDSRDSEDQSYEDAIREIQSPNLSRVATRASVMRSRSYM